MAHLRWIQARQDTWTIAAEREHSLSVYLVIWRSQACKSEDASPYIYKKEVHVATGVKTKEHNLDNETSYPPKMNPVFC